MVTTRSAIEGDRCVALDSVSAWVLFLPGFSSVRIAEGKKGPSTKRMCRSLGISAVVGCGPPFLSFRLHLKYSVRQRVCLRSDADREMGRGYPCFSFLWSS